jgi:uncharacterized protein YndB with AHSA1/START domain
MEDRFDADIEALWSALTDPGRLGRWLGTFEGDVRPGGEFRALFHASGWEGTGRVESCEPPRRLRVTTRQKGESYSIVIEATLTRVGDQTDLVVEERGMPVAMLAAWGAGDQVHIEDLADHILGHERREMGTRWAKLLPAYEALAAAITAKP